MPTDDTTRAPASHQPTVDPRLMTVATRLRRMRVELDRLVDAIDLLDRDQRARFGHRAADLRAQIDELDADVEREAAGL